MPSKKRSNSAPAYASPEAPSSARDVHSDGERDGANALSPNIAKQLPVAPAPSVYEGIRMANIAPPLPPRDVPVTTPTPVAPVTTPAPVVPASPKRNNLRNVLAALATGTVVVGGSAAFVLNNGLQLLGALLPATNPVLAFVGVNVAKVAALPVGYAIGATAIATSAALLLVIGTAYLTGSLVAKAVNWAKTPRAVVAPAATSAPAVQAGQSTHRSLSGSLPKLGTSAPVVAASPVVAAQAPTAEVSTANVSNVSSSPRTPRA